MIKKRKLTEKNVYIYTKAKSIIYIHHPLIFKAKLSHINHKIEEQLIFIKNMND